MAGFAMASREGHCTMMALDAEAQDFSVLIADDEPSSRETLRGIVEPLGFRTILAPSGEHAIDIVRSMSIHLALLDLNLGRMSGLDVLRMARQVVAGLPAILVTADATVKVMRDAQREDVYSVIPKPVTRSVVIYTVTRALAQRYGAPVNPPLQPPVG
jgi:hypothetical protein